MTSNTAFDVIKYDGDQNNNVLVHKYSVEDFNLGSVLVVNESQQALLYKDGICEGPFIAGRHTLITNNLPTFRERFARFFSLKKDKFEKKTPFTVEVYFVNMVNDLPILWGTPNPIQLEDPKYNILLRVGARGNVRIRVVDASRFVISVCGQIKDYTVDRVKSTIKADMLPIVSTLISQTINNKGVSILEINNYLLDLSQEVLAKLNVRLAEFGLEALHLNIEGIEASEDDLTKLRQIKEKYREAMTDIDIEAVKTTKLAAARAEGRRLEGYTYQEEKQFDVLSNAAKNEGMAGSVMGASMGMGMGFGLGGNMGNAMNKVSNAMNAQTVACPTCGAQISAGGKFCPLCGASVEVKTLTCQNCNAQIPEGSKFCPSCGKPVATSSFCTKCGSKVQAGSKFCPNCGESL